MVASHYGRGTVPGQSAPIPHHVLQTFLLSVVVVNQVSIDKLKVELPTEIGDLQLEISDNTHGHILDTLRQRQYRHRCLLTNGVCFSQRVLL